LVMVIGEDGFYQYRFKDDQMKLLSHIPVSAQQDAR